MMSVAFAVLACRAFLLPIQLEEAFKKKNKNEQHSKKKEKRLEESFNRTLVIR